MFRLKNLRLLWLENFFGASKSLAARFGRAQVLPEHLETGQRGEEAAFLYLRRQGCVVVARGWRSGKVAGDLDLIAWEGQTLCFVEVKTRTSRKVATAESAVDHKKVYNLRRLARHYLRSLPVEPASTRFDILSIYLEDSRPPDFEFFRGAFDWY